LMYQLWFTAAERQAKAAIYQARERAIRWIGGRK
jgi:hypothetical protein